MKEKLKPAFEAFKVRRDFSALPPTSRVEVSGFQRKAVGLVGWRENA